MPKANEDDGVHRLTDMLVEEVSVVDRAANGQRFLLVKSEGGIMELQPDGRGGFVRVSKAAAADDVDKKAPAFAGAAPPFGGDKGKDGKDEPDPKKKQFSNEDDLNKTKKADAEGMALAKSVQEIATKLAKLGEDLEGEEASEPSDVHMKKIMECHKSLSGMCEKYAKRAATKGLASVAKLGAKMSAPRLEKVKAAFNALQEILSEVMETPGSAAEHKPEAGDPQVAVAGFNKANPSGNPNAVGAAVLKGLEDMADLCKEQKAAIVKAQATIAEQGAEIRKLSKGIDTGNSTTVEKAGGARKGSENVVWPMDMNGDRKKVDKSLSFRE